METIITYVENVFKTLPATPQVLDIKENLLADMDAKYQDLRSEGISEHEATARVIGGFGNIDELLSELDIGSTALEHNDDDRVAVSHEEAFSFIEMYIKASKRIATGITLIMLGVALMLGTLAFTATSSTERLDWDVPAGQIMTQLGQQATQESNSLLIPLALLFLLVTPGVALLIQAGFSLERFKHFERGTFSITHSLKHEIEQQSDAYQPRFTSAIITGVALCMVAVMLFIMAILLDAVPTLTAVALLVILLCVPTVIFVRSGMRKSGYDQLLHTGDYRPEAKDAERVLGAVAAFVFPAAACTFFIWGFVFGGWKIAWIVFPVTGMLFGGFAGLYSVLKGID